MKVSRKKIVVIATSILVVIGGVILYNSIFGKQKMPVDSTLKVEFSGVNGYGTATLYDELDWIDKVEFKRNSTSTEIWAYKMVLSEAVNYSLSKSENLSNGDVIEVKISVDHERLEQYGLKAESMTKKFKVSGLAKAKKIDPFKEGKLDYSIYGISGAGSMCESGYCIIDLGKDETLELRMELEVKKGEDGRLANGDVIYARIDDEESDSYLANSYGIVLTTREADIVIGDMRLFTMRLQMKIFLLQVARKTYMIT